MKTALPGRHYPLGVHLDEDGINVAVFAEHADHVDVVLTDNDGNEQETYALIDYQDFTFFGRVPGVKAGQRYGFRAHGAYDPANGRRYNENKLLVDPYARAITGAVTWGPEVFGYQWGKGDDSAKSKLDSVGKVPLSVVVDENYTWQDDRPPRTSWAETIIYEVNVGGFTKRNPDIPYDLRGTYAGMAHPAALQHLKQLGITAVELMPVHHFIDPAHLTERGLRNYWGYDTLGYFAPEARYSSSGSAGEQVNEFKQMVAALHQAGIEVFLDVVYNHTCEGNEMGPTLCFRGMDNESYYRLVDGNLHNYVDVTGCGNTLNVRHFQTLQMIMDSLRYWVTEMHIDGFRFDLATSLARQETVPDRMSAFFDIVHQDPVLSSVKLIAEPWDIGIDGYQVGNFPVRWAEWNGRYRDTVRDYWRNYGSLGEMAYRLSGSSDLYQADGRSPLASVNFVTAHDGFTMRDLVSYNQKHNEENGEENRDGSDDNRSWNCGAEGQTDDPEVLKLRAKQQRNFLATLLLSQGCPMILSGDEIGRTQNGNNNAYCQDNELAWLNWAQADRDLLSFTQALIALRKKEAVFHRQQFFQGQIGRGQDRKDIAWLRPDGTEIQEQDWTSNEVRSIGMWLNGDLLPGRDADGGTVHGSTIAVLMNNGGEDITWQIAPAYGKEWELLIDTAWPNDAKDVGGEPASVLVDAHSLVVLRRIDHSSPA